MFVLFSQNQEGEMKKAESEGIYRGSRSSPVVLTDHGGTPVN